MRARGASHGWSPLTITPGTASDAPVLLVDTAAHLTGLALESPTTVRAGAGVTLEALLTYLEEHGLGITATPAPGNSRSAAPWPSTRTAPPFRRGTSVGCPGTRTAR